jgi:xanthine dehydrogenase accessory factor
MNDLGPVLALWSELDAAGVEFVLATIVAVDGPSYRKPGARMLIGSDGRRAGTVSGGCLEEEIARKAFWNTREGAVVEVYSTGDDDGERPFGSGCGGRVKILLEREATAWPLMHVLVTAYKARLPLTIATIIQGERIGEHAITSGVDAKAESHANENIFIEDSPARKGLWVLGAGNDAQPLVRMAHQLGWFVAVMDGRTQLATRERFPEAEQVFTPQIGELLHTGLPAALHTTDAVAILSHSFEQDSHFLAALFKAGAEKMPAYLGVLGPRERTRELLTEAARLLELEPDEGLVEGLQVDGWMAQLHSPIGLDLGGTDAASIALSILAEIEQERTASTARPMREVRGEH